MSILTERDKRRIRSLLTKKGRRQHRQFLAEGVRLLEESLRHNFLPATIFFSPAELNERGQSLIGRFREFGVSVQSISRKELFQLADTETPQGLIAIFDEPEHSVKQYLTRKYFRALLLDNIADPGNAGTLLRSALAFGFDLALFGPGTVDQFSPKTIRASSGAVFGLPIIRIEPESLNHLKESEPVLLLAADINGMNLNLIKAERFRQGRLILAVGSEATGLSGYVRAAIDELVRIPHRDTIESLNAAVAGSIIMKAIYDAGRQV